MSNSSRLRGLAAVVAAVAWFALVLQYLLLIRMTLDTIGPALATLRYVSFFTILSNLLVAATATVAVSGARSPIGRFFCSARVRGGVALCIAITCAIYFFVLSSTWAPRGAQLLADVLLHYAVPALYLTWWFLGTPHGHLYWTDTLRWLLFPGMFLAWTLARGAWLHEYPYPFLDVDALGLAAVLRNSLGIAVLFVLGGLVIVAIEYLRRTRSREAPAGYSGTMEPVTPGAGSDDAPAR